MKKVVAFGASTSRQSINKALAAYAASLLPEVEVEVLDLNDFELPLFSADKEEEIGQPRAAKDFLSKLASADGLVISFAEHNGSYAAAYKNLFDWCSRIDKAVFQNKPAIYLSTSPGQGGAKSVLALAIQSAGFFGAEVKSSLSVPKFYEAFDRESGSLLNKELNAELLAAVGELF
ncbi:MAG: NAD(P)H-dependent oxidoreductase [Acidiferrobacterales bacterium]|nr:NAD(P)H-dependent oxidoreductase [Acidiferrobacterales bacterium]